MSLKDWITRRLSGLEADTPEDRGRVDLAVAALLVEVLRADYDVAPQERQQVIVSVSRLLGLDATVSAALVAEAERHIDKSHDLYQFTQRLRWSEPVFMEGKVQRFGQYPSWLDRIRSDHLQQDALDPQRLVLKLLG